MIGDLFIRTLTDYLGEISGNPIGQGNVERSSIDKCAENIREIPRGNLNLGNRERKCILGMKTSSPLAHPVSTVTNIPDSGALPGATWPPSPGFRRRYRGYPSSPVCVSCNI
ncbi:hypothetical protein TNCT_124601 [Trichonephila clavata]|uniref:Uncharacterized protein n=1 Tax=Trichonephila clavata TaxID=2740835 RepID=A0A8X6L5F8_TRICU|nr:hypothetical protein TNCT_124601 [Trichonephila clavata]